MSKIKIDSTVAFNFHTNIPIRITDINYGGHVGNDTFLTLIHEARLQFLNHYHFSEMDFGGVGLIMRDIVIEFKKEIFYGDSLSVHVAIGNFSRAGFEVFYKLVLDNKEMVAALAKTGMICYNYKIKKIVSVPEIILQTFQ